VVWSMAVFVDCLQGGFEGEDRKVERLDVG